MAEPHAAAPRSQRLATALLALAATLFAVAVAECGLRLAHYGSIRGLSGEHSLRDPHPVRGWALRPGGHAFQRTKDYGIPVRINGMGLRDREHTLAPDPGVFRVVVLGDSYMEAYQVLLEQSLPYLLQELLADRGVESVNLGVGGYGTAQEYLALRDDGLRYQPELVVLAFYAGNDVGNNSRAIQERLLGPDDLKVFGRPYAVSTGPGAALRWEMPDAERVAAELSHKQRRRSGPLPSAVRFLQPSVLANAVERGIASVGQRVSGMPAYDPNVSIGWPFMARFAPEYAVSGITEAEYDTAWREAWDATRGLLLATRDLARDNGAKFAVMLVPTRFQVEPEFRDRMRAHHPAMELDVLRINRALAAFTASNGIAFVDLTPTFAEAHAAGRGPLHHEIEDHHWNATGHRLAAETLAARIDALGLLP